MVKAVLLIAAFLPFLEAADSLCDRIRDAEQLRISGSKYKAIAAYEALASSTGGSPAALSTVHNNLAALYQETGDVYQAQSHYDIALELREKTFGPDHPATAVVLNNFATFLRDREMLVDAEKMARRAADIWEAAGAVDAVLAWNNLGEIYSSTGRFAQADPCFRRAIEICRKDPKIDPALYAQSLNNLGVMFRRQGKLQGAEKLYRQAIEVANDQVAHNNLALLLEAEGRVRESGRSR